MICVGREKTTRPLRQFVRPAGRQQQKVTIRDGLCQKRAYQNHEQSVVALAREPAATAPPSDDLHVLVVDDEPRVRKMLADSLEGQSIRVVTAANGAAMWA